MPDNISESVTELLRQSRVALPSGGVDVASASDALDTVFCSTTKLFAKTQYLFYVAFQATVAALAFGVVAALIIFIVRLTNGVDVTGVVGTLGTLATGSAAGFLQKQANAARSRYRDAMSALQNANCP